MSDYLQRYLPEYDEDAERLKLKGFTREDLAELLLLAYKERRVLEKMLAEMEERQRRLRAILDEPSRLAAMPDIPGPEDLRRMVEDTADPQSPSSRP